MILIEGFIKRFGNDLFLGWIPKFKGLMVEGETIDEVKRELIISLKVKLAYDYKLDIHAIQSEEITSLKDIPVASMANDEYQFEYAL
jgi:hypothetical protein